VCVTFLGFSFFFFIFGGGGGSIVDRPPIFDMLWLSLALDLTTPKTKVEFVTSQLLIYFDTTCLLRRHIDVKRADRNHLQINRIVN